MNLEIDIEFKTYKNESHNEEEELHIFLFKSVKILSHETRRCSALSKDGVNKS